jgi:hypothetical protein
VICDEHLNTSQSGRDAQYANNGLTNNKEVINIMDADMQRQLALLKFSIIAPLCNDTYDAPSKEAFCRRLAQTVYTFPNGKKRSFSADTIKNWALAYKKNGFDALVCHCTRITCRIF